MIVEVFLPIILALIGSSGLWSFIASLRKRNKRLEALIHGLTFLVLKDQVRYHTAKGEITQDEFSVIYGMVYTKYKELGGNGASERLVAELSNLPTSREGYHDNESTRSKR